MGRRSYQSPFLTFMYTGLVSPLVFYLPIANLEHFFMNFLFSLSFFFFLFMLVFSNRLVGSTLTREAGGFAVPIAVVYGRSMIKL